MAGSTSQSASSDGHHNIIVQASGDGIHVEVGLPHLTLVPVGARLRKTPRHDIDILNPVYQAVPLVGRAEDLAFLREWLAADRGIAVTAVIGRGGSGKTRLALELLQQLPVGWQGGFLTQQEAQRRFKAENFSQWSWQRPTLVVVDDAALMTDVLGGWLSELADHAAPEHPLRILLLERHADLKSGWYRDLADRSWHGEAVEALFFPREPRVVRPLGPDGERRAVLAAGLEAAYALAPVGTARPSLPGPGVDVWVDQKLGDGQWVDPLLLLMAGVISVSNGLSAALSLSRPDLAKRLACRERDRVRRAVEDRAAQDVLAHLYACVTMCGGLVREQAGAIADQELAALRKSYPGGAGQAVDDLARVLGAGDTLPPVAPDLLAGALLIETLGQRAPAAAGRLAVLAPGRVAATWIRATQDFAPSGDPLPTECLEVLVTKGLEDLPILEAIETNLPDSTVALRRLAVAVTEALLQQTRDLGGASAASIDRVHEARLLHKLSVRQSYMGHWGKALASIAEAVYLFRNLSKENPGAFLSDLASSLDSLATTQGAMGQRREALSSSTEAVCLYRNLAEVHPDAFRPALATALNNLSNTQSEMGQRGEALSSIAEATRLYRDLAEANADAFRPNLAMVLNNLSHMQGKVGQRSEALTSITEATRLYRDLAEANADAFRPNLAMSLNDLAAIQAGMGQRGEALASIAESVHLYRNLTKENPDAFQPDLAASLSNLAISQSGMGQQGEALASSMEAARLFRDLTEASPDAFQPSLASSLSNLSSTQRAMGRQDEALASSTEAVRLYRALAAKNPDAFEPDLAISLNNQSNIQCELGQHRDSLSSITEAVCLYRNFAEARPDVFRPDLAMALNNLAAMLSAMGQWREALSSIAEAVRIWRDLAEANPDAFRSYLAMALNNLAGRQREMGQWGDALSSIAEAVRSYRDLAEVHPDAFRPALARSLSASGDCLAAAGRVVEARSEAEEALRVLGPYFLRYPEAHGPLAKVTMEDYAKWSEALGVAMDPEVLLPYQGLL